MDLVWVMYMYLPNLRLSLILIHPLPQEEQEEQEEEEEEMHMTASVCLFVCVIQLLDTYILNPGLITIILMQTFESCLPLILIHPLPPCSHYNRCD